MSSFFGWGGAPAAPSIFGWGVAPSTIFGWGVAPAKHRFVGLKSTEESASMMPFAAATWPRADVWVKAAERESLAPLSRLPRAVDKPGAETAKQYYHAGSAKARYAALYAVIRE